jgi:hypothetical protein
MNTYETSATVEDQGRVQIVGVPFATGTQVEVSVSPKRSSAEEFAVTWQRVCAALRARPGLQNITDEDIGDEIDRYRAGQ